MRRWQYRKQYKLLKDGKQTSITQTSITQERIGLLNSMNFAWNAQEAAWDRHISDLKRFKKKYGHCHVPLNHPDYPKLGLWVKEQRRHYSLFTNGKSSHMTKERRRELDELGFCWDTHEASWLERSRQLTLYKEKNGDCMVPVGWTENPKLSTWVHHQRRQYKRWVTGKPSHINAARIKTLESMGFCWNARDKLNDYEGGNKSDRKNGLDAQTSIPKDSPGDKSEEVEDEATISDHSSSSLEEAVAASDADTSPLSKRKRLDL